MFDMMMLSFSKFCRQTRDLKFIFSVKSNPLKIGMIVDPSHISVHNNRLFQFKLCSTFVSKETVIPLEEINDLARTNKNFDAEKLTLLKNEILKHKALGRSLPEYIKLIDVRDILECETSSQRSKTLIYLFKKEQIRLRSKEKKLKNKMVHEDKYDSKNNSHIQYGLGKNTLILRAFKRNIMNFYNKRLANAVLFGQKIVIDLGYDKLMNQKERKACISQIRLLYSINKLNRDPYDLYICNASSESRCVEHLRQEMPNIDETFATLAEQSYLDLFPKENLVYLSPHASETLISYDHKAVYIIGGFVDTVKGEHVSSSKAQEEGIKCYRLPLEEFVIWGNGTKSLTINQVFSILQTKRDTDDWKEAFKHLPSRKLKKVDINSDNAELYSEKLYAISNN